MNHASPQQLLRAAGEMHGELMDAPHGEKQGTLPLRTQPLATKYVVEVSRNGVCIMNSCGQLTITKG